VNSNPRLAKRRSRAGTITTVSPYGRQALSALLAHPHDQGNDEKDQKYEEQNLGYFDGTCGNAAKTQNRRDDGYDKKDCSPLQHDDPLLIDDKGTLSRALPLDDSRMDDGTASCFDRRSLDESLVPPPLEVRRDG
jgi:hypothetical protein